MSWPMKWLGAVWRWLRVWWWTVLLAAGVVVFFAWRFLRPGPTLDKGTQVPKFIERAAAEAERVRLEGEVEKARVEARAEAQHKELDRIEELGDTEPAEARRQLTNWLNANL